jgi:hypothetical protein
MRKKLVLLSFLGVIGLAVGLALAAGAPQALARSLAQSGAPALISYQGYLTDDVGQPISGTVDLKFELYAASSGGSALWSETQTGVTVSNGFFSTLLGSVTPLSAADFDATTRYLQVSVDTGGGFTDMPRQRLASAPYALQAEEAKRAASADSATTASSADSAPWSGLTGVPAGFADDTDDDVLGGLSCGDGQVVKWSDVAGEWTCGDDNSGGGYENVIVVARSGGDYSSVADALDSIASPAADNRYLVWVAPGVYTETLLAQVQGYVHLQGAGPNATLIKSSRSGGTPGPDAATLQLDDNGRVSDVSIVNQGTGTFGIAIYSALATRAAIVDNVVAEVNGAGGVGHYAAYLNDSEVNIRNSTLKATGAVGFGTAVNAAVGIVNISDGFPQPLIENSKLIGGNNNGITCVDATGTGFGLQMVNASPDVRDSYVCGGHRGIFVGTAGNAQIRGSHVEVSSTGSAFLFETTGSATVLVANSGVFYVGNKHTGVGGLTCIHSYKSNYTAATDGTTSGTACN